jgi:hypothetical protein
VRLFSESSSKDARVENIMIKKKFDPVSVPSLVKTEEISGKAYWRKEKTLKFGSPTLKSFV